MAARVFASRVVSSAGRAAFRTPATRSVGGAMRRSGAAGTRQMSSQSAALARFRITKPEGMRWAWHLGAATGVAVALAGGMALAKDEKVDYDEVRQAIRDVLDSDSYDDGSYGPVLVRLAWHASGTFDKCTGTGGSNGATMRFHPECAHGANAGLQTARSLLEKVKRKFPGISYADLWTLAGAVAVEEMGGPHIPWRPGRSDAKGPEACPPDGRLPDASQGAQHVRDIFHRMGFNDREIVALVGAHALGRCHTDRSGYSGPWTNSPTTFSNEFFVQLSQNKWTPKRWSGPHQYEDPSGKLMMLPTDVALLDDPKFRAVVLEYAENEEAFFKDFASAFSRLLELGTPMHNGWLKWFCSF